jgi:amidase
MSKKSVAWDEGKMNRRNFMVRGAAGGAALFLDLSLPSKADGLGNAALENGSFELQEMTISALQEAMQKGRWTSEGIVEKYLQRIEKIDRQGPKVNSIIELNPDALAMAKALDEERRGKGARGPLHGIPILLKDNIDTADRMVTSAGSLALCESRSSQDAFIVKKLRAAGAVILGKTNLSEWANFRSTRSSSGWSGRGGQTRNPYILDRNPCGSSSGSGVAVSANLASAAVGTETDGSIVCPSSINGIVGIKPTLGLLSRSGIIPIAHSQDTAGPMARTVADAAILLSALCGADPQDVATASRQDKSPEDYSKYLDLRGLEGARIGIVRNLFGFDERVDRLMEQTLELLKKEGAVVIDPANLPNSGKYDDSESEVLLYEFKADLNRYLAQADPKLPVRSLKDLIEFNEKNRDREMPHFGQELFRKAEAKGPLTERAYLNALKKNRRLSRQDGIDAVMSKHRLDALMAPTGGPAWLTDWVCGDHSSGGSSSPAAVSGYPAITVPAGFISSLPVGVTFFGRAYSEPTLIKIAFAFEQVAKVRRPPKFLATSESTE